MSKKIIINIIFILLILNIPLVLYLLNFRLMLFDEDFYQREFEKHGVYETVGKENVDKVNSELLAYFRDGKKNNLLDTEFFNLEEKKHLLDVKGVLQNVFSLFNFLVIISVLLLAILVCFRDYKKTALILVLGGALTLVISSILIVSFGFNFDASFALFHKLLFKEGTWLFPSSGNLVNMYPGGFFYDITKDLFINTTLQAFALVFMGISVLIFLFNHKIIKKEKYLNKALKIISRK